MEIFNINKFDISFLKCWTIVAQVNYCFYKFAHAFDLWPDYSTKIQFSCRSTNLFKSIKMIKKVWPPKERKAICFCLLSIMSQIWTNIYYLKFRKNSLHWVRIQHLLFREQRSLIQVCGCQVSMATFLFKTIDHNTYVQVTLVQINW